MHENKPPEATFSEKVTVQYSTASLRNPPARPGECTARRSVREVIDDEGTAEPVVRNGSAGGRAGVAATSYTYLSLSLEIVLDEHVGVARVMGCALPVEA